VAIPGLEVVFRAVRVSWLARVVALVMIFAVGYQFADFLHWHSRCLHRRSPTDERFLPDGGFPPVGSVLFYRFQTCDFPCTEIERWNDYWLARFKGPKPS